MNTKESKISFHASPILVLLAILMFVLCAACGYYYYTTSSSSLRRHQTLESTNRTLTAANAALSGDFSDQRAEKVRKDAEAVRSHMLSSSEADNFIASLRPIWSVVTRTEEDSGDFLRRRIQIVRGSAPVSAWPEVQSVVNRIAGVQAMALGNVDIQTVGDNRKREFSRITLTLFIYIRKPNAASQKSENP